ncbi:MAG: DUF4738 domain-containing protein [Prevotella sp.]|jgi:hypothetical protein|nr:DUF4738 domain-containing protein [Prevotella sp.]
MKNIWFLAILLLGAFTMASCGGKKPSNDIIAHKPVIAKPAKTQKMGDYKQQNSAQWIGSTYKINIDFRADASLPVISEGAQKYYDNRITLQILRKDGSEFFKREFTKADFSSYIDANYSKKGALLGIVFDKAEGDNLVFAASVGSPDTSSDDYVPLVLKISRQGGVTISKDSQLDTGAVEKSSSDDENEAI